MSDMIDDKFECTIVPMQDHGFFWITMTGALPFDRLGKVHEEFTSHPEYEPGVDEFLDLSHASISHMTKAEMDMIRTFMIEAPTRHNCKSAVVVNSALEYGLGRMMGARMDRVAPVERFMSYSVEDALEWMRPGQANQLLTEYSAVVQTQKSAQD